MSLGKCRFCVFEKEAKCSKKKNSKIKLNKRRHCDFFTVDEEKAADFLDRRETNSKPQVIEVPEWWHIRDIRRQVMKTMEAEEQAKFVTTAVDNSKHPLTGDLGRFSSTAEPTMEVKNSGDNI